MLAEARDNVTFGTVDEWAGLAEPDGVAAADQALWNEALAAFPTDRKIELAKELERLTLGADPRVRVDDSNYADALGEAAVATTTGIRRCGRENGCYVSVSTLADDGDETQTGFGFSVGRPPDEFDLEKAAREAADRATRLLGAVKPAVEAPHRRARPVRHRPVPRRSSPRRSTARPSSRVAACSGTASASRSPPPFVTLVDDPTNPLAYTATDVDGEGLAARRNVLIEDGVLRQFVHNSYSARRAGTVSTGNAVRGGFAGTPGVGAWPCSWCRAPGRRPSSSPTSTTVCSCRACRASTRASTRSAATSRPVPPG